MSNISSFIKYLILAVYTKLCWFYIRPDLSGVQSCIVTLQLISNFQLASSDKAMHIGTELINNTFPFNQEKIKLTNWHWYWLFYRESPIHHSDWKSDNFEIINSNSDREKQNSVPSQNSVSYPYLKQTFLTTFLQKWPTFVYWTQSVRSINIIWKVFKCDDFRFFCHLIPSKILRYDLTRRWMSIFAI